MVEMRWYSTDNQPPRLQYRVYIDHTSYALPAGVPPLRGHETMRWSMWRDVPEVHEPPRYSNSSNNSNKCPKCGLVMEGAMGYVCSDPQCPTGLGGSRS